VVAFVLLDGTVCDEELEAELAANVNITVPGEHPVNVME
jgi:hypothetical protein